MNTKVKETIKGMINGIMGDYITYEWSGSDFSERVSDESGVNVVDKERSVELDMDLYNKFVEHLTEHLCSGLEEDN